MMINIRKEIRKILLEWFPGKEPLIFFEELAKKQKRIYNDAADYGIVVDEKTKNEIRTNLRELMKLHGSSIERGEWGSRVKIFVPIEMDEGLISGETLSITQNVVRNPRHPSLIQKNIREFFSIDIGRKNLTDSDAQKFYGFKGLKESRILFSEMPSTLARNKRFCVTGTCTIPRKKVWAAIEEAGGIVDPYVRRETDYLVLCADTGGGKTRRAEELGTTVISEKDFWHLIRGGRPSEKELRPWRGQGIHGVRRSERQYRNEREPTFLDLIGESLSKLISEDRSFESEWDESEQNEDYEHDRAEAEAEYLQSEIDSIVDNIPATDNTSDTHLSDVVSDLEIYGELADFIDKHEDEASYNQLYDTIMKKLPQIVDDRDNILFGGGEVDKREDFHSDDGIRND